MYPKEYTDYEIKWLEENESKLNTRTNSVKSLTLQGDYVDLTPKTYYNFDIEEIRKLGGDRLVTFYLCGANYYLASVELGVKENALRVFIFRLREKLLSQGFTPSDLHRLLKRKAM